MSNPRGRHATNALIGFSSKRLLRRLRSRGLSANELDLRVRERWGVTITTSAYTSGKYRPAIEGLYAICRELGCREEDLFEEKDQEDAA